RRRGTRTRATRGRPARRRKTTVPPVWARAARAPRATGRRGSSWRPRRRRPSRQTAGRGTSRSRCGTPTSWSPWRRRSSPASPSWTRPRPGQQGVPSPTKTPRAPEEGSGRGRAGVASGACSAGSRPGGSRNQAAS
uniref:Uncharacterized protein n=1 Tax=Triticum urartu TaxID=4572 RepID=A0A8R7QT48_TRIUA